MTSADAGRHRDPAGAAPRVSLLVVEGCPHRDAAYANLRAALDAAGLAAARVRVVRVRSLEHARRIGFTGSPTVLVDDGDLFAEDAPPVGLSCRVYPTPAGSAGAPTVDQLTLALERRMRRASGRSPAS